MILRAPRGTERVCQTWAAEAAYRLLQNNLDPEVAEHPEQLVVYGGRGKAARNPECLRALLEVLPRLGSAETLLVQSGKPVAVLQSHEEAPRVLIANSNLVPRWATWEHFDALDRAGLMMFGQMTAGSWIYIGTQGILQGTYETFAACGRKHFGAGTLPLKGRSVVSGGLGGMGGAQPMAAKLAGAAFLGVEIDGACLRRRLATGFLDEVAESLPEAWRRVQECAVAGEARSIGLVGNISQVLGEMLAMDLIPDVVTDQTSAHDPLHGYVPDDSDLAEAIRERAINPVAWTRQARAGIARHVKHLLAMRARGAVVFDYGNNIRAVASEEGITEAFSIPGFVPEYIRPQFCEGAGPFRWVALSGDPQDIAVTDRVLLEMFPDNEILQNWLRNGAPCVPFQGLPARICWLRYGERARAGLRFNELVRNGDVKAPIVIGRDHLDCGSVASPTRETEGMQDGSDAVADWAFLNAMINAVNGASWVSVHQGGGVGMGYSQHAGMVIVADGTEAAARRLKRVLNTDPATGIVRHADAGYSSAIASARRHGIDMPMLDC